MKNLIHYLDRGIISLDENFKIINWNNWLETKTFITQKDAINKELSELFPEIASRFSYKQLQRAVKNKNTLILSPLLHKFLIPIKNPSIYLKQGIDQMIQSVNGIAVNEDNHFKYYLIQIEDHTERFLKEIKLKKFYSDLSKKNTELAKIQHELEEKNKILEEASRYKSEFLANMSHEIRTPMNSILGVNELLIEDSDNLNDSQKEMLNVISVSSSSLMELINNILDLAKISAQKFELENIEFELESVLIDMFKVTASKTFDKDIDLICNCPHLSNHLVGDITRIKQILTNLMGNAAKFTEKGFISLTATYEKNLLNLEVSDSGIGIADENIDKIFDSFVQADGSTTRKFGGTGLGLSLCKELCELMGGTISISSQINKGTTFKIALPIKPGSKLAPLDCHETAKMKIIYICKDEDSLKAMTALAAELNLNLSTYSVEDSMTSLNEDNWDIVLVDQLSVTNELINILEKRQFKKIINIHRTLSNSFATNPTFNHHLAKPFTHKHFISLLKAKNTDKTVTSVNEFDVTSCAKNKILIAEDNKSNQFLLKKILKNKYDFTFANNGEEAVTEVKNNSYDLVLMDILMPVMDGLQATEEIRKFNTDIPILALTANNLASDRDKCLSCGMNDFIVKPINRELLIQKIEDFANRSS